MRTPRQWWNDRTRAKRRRQAAEATKHEPLREFVYLDEVSVYSLLASRIGALATDFTESESSSLSSDFKTQSGIATPVARAQLSTGVRTTQGSGSQVMRKSTVQSSFRELHGYISDGLRLAAPATTMPQIRDIEGFEREAERDTHWVVRADSLQRGDLVELDVALDADDAFRASTILTTLYSFIREFQQTPGWASTKSMGEAITAMRVLEGLLAGVVPVRGRALEYRSVIHAGREYIVHRAICDQMGSSLAPAAIEVVGICEADLFWRDLRRVVFSSSPYRILCRVGRTGLVDDWSPVKLTDVLEGVVPGLRDIIDEMPRVLAKVHEEQQTDETPTTQMRKSLELYADNITSAAGHSLAPGALAALGLPTAEQCSAYRTMQERRAAFAELTELLESEFGIEVDIATAARQRSAALVEAGLLDLEMGQPASQQGSGSVNRARYLDSEVIAIYW